MGVLLAATVVPVRPALAQTTAALPFPPPAQARPAVLGMRLGIHPDKTRLVLELSESIPFSVSLLGEPHRVVVDLPDVSWRGGDGPQAGKGLIARYRIETRPVGASRLVIETAGPVKVLEAFTLPAKEGLPPRFVIDLERATPAEFARLAAASPPPPPAAAPQAGPHAAPQSAPASIPAPAPAAIPVPPQPSTEAIVPASVPLAPPAPPPAARSQPAPSRPVRAMPLVVIDPGHGGVDPGAIGVGGIHEKDITLAAAREVARQLEASGRYRVALTRDKDFFIPLRDRVAIARDLDADLFISLHADSIGTSAVRGLSIYTLSDKASDREAESLAAKENRADAIAGLNLSGENNLVASILIDLAQRDTMNHSRRFANLALDSLGHDIKLIPNKPHRQAGFAVLTAPDMPSALIEMGYLSSPQDASLLTAPAHREKLGRALVRTIDSYFRWLNGSRKA